MVVMDEKFPGSNQPAVMVVGGDDTCNDIDKHNTDVDAHKSAQNTKTVQSTEQNSENRKYQITKTTCLVFVWLAMGMMASMPGPTTPDLRDRLGVDMQTISLVLSFKNLGVPLGCILSGMICDRYRFWTDLIGGCCLILTGCCSISKPHIYNLPLLAFSCFMEGVGHGGIDAAGHAMIPWMWHEKAAPPMNAIHLGYPIGETLAPLVAANFLLPRDEEEENMTTTAYSTTPSYMYMGRGPGNVARRNAFDGENKEIATNVTLQPPVSTIIPADEEAISKIEIPYGIAGGLAILMASWLIVLFLYGYRHDINLYGKSKGSIKEVFSAKSFKSAGNTKFTVKILAFVCLFLGFAGAASTCIGQFIFSYAVDSELAFSTDEASALDATYKAMAILSRLTCVIISKWVSVQLILGVSVVLNITFYSCLTFLGTQEKAYLWAFACTYQLFSAPLWPCSHVWSSRYITYSAMVVAFVQVSNSVLIFFIQWLGGYLYDTYRPEAVIYLGWGLAWVFVVVWIIMQTTASRQGKRNRDRQAKSWIDTSAEYPSTADIYTESTKL